MREHGPQKYERDAAQRNVVVRQKRLLATKVDGILWVLPGTLWLIVFAVIPVASLLIMSFWKSSIFGLTPDFTLDNYRTLVSEWVYTAVLIKTLRMGVLATILALVVSYPIAWLLASLRGTAKAVAVLLLFVPFWSSYVVRTFIWLPLLGRHGLVNYVLMGTGLIDSPVEWLLHSEPAVYVGLVYVYLLFMTLPIYQSLDQLDPSLLEASSDLGAGPLQTLIKVVLPLSAPGVISGCIMVFLLSCGAYVTPQLLGGNAGQMFGTIIAAQFLQTNNWALGAALSVVLMVIVFFCLFVVGRRVKLSEVLLGGRTW